MLLSAFLVITISGTSMAQGATDKDPNATPRPKGELPMLNRIPNLNDTQKEQIKKLHLALIKEIQPIQNQIGEKQARLRTLSSEEKPDMKSINAIIDEISILKANTQKKRMAFMQDVRKLLTDEQRIMFDQHNQMFSKKAAMRKDGNRQGPMGCNRQGPMGGKKCIR